MVKVKNVKVEEIPFKSKDKNFLRCLEYAKSIDPNCEKFIPQKPKYRMRFELTDTTADLANCIRRYLLDEYPVHSLDVDETEIETDDPFILNDFLKKNIEMVPFKQELSDKDITDLNISLSAENKTSESMTVRISHMSTNKGDIEKYMTSNTPIGELRSGKKLSIKNIKITTGLGKHDSAKFLLPSNVYYEIMDVKPRTETKFEKSGTSSLNSNPAHFRIGYTTHRNINAKLIMKTCCDEIINNFGIILKDLGNIKESDNVYFSDFINLETKGDVKQFIFIEHYRTTSNIISRYCYLTHKDIKFVCSAIIHPSIEKCIVKISHPQSLKIIISAVKKIIADATIIKKAF